MTTLVKLSTKTLVSAAIIASLTVVPVYAKASTEVTKTAQQTQAQQNENIGFGAGMVVGAIFGGPAGAFITGIAGNFIAKSMNAEEEIEQINHAYQQEKQSNEQALLAYQRRLEQAEQAYHQELLALEQNYQATSALQAENLLMSLQFSTGSSEIKPHYQEQIQALAKIIAQSPQLTIDLSGYTDKQGSDELNQALSLARINAVKSALIDQGVASDRIQLFAYGEQHPIVANNSQEVSFYDRRVVIKLNNNAVAQGALSNPANEKHTQTAKNF